MAPRSRTGCLTCRQRKLKCSEERPVCAQCTKASRECIPASGITFRHQQNPSMNAEDHGEGSLKNFYGYKETFGKHTTWVEIPKDLTFVHTSNPYDDGDDRPGGIAGYDDGDTTFMTDDLASFHDTHAGAELDLHPTTYPSYATHGLEALSAVASQDQYSFAPPPSSMDTHDQTSPRQSAVQGLQPGPPATSQNIDYILNPSSAKGASPAISNLDPQLHSPTNSAKQAYVSSPEAHQSPFEHVRTSSYSPAHDRASLRRKGSSRGGGGARGAAITEPELAFLLRHYSECMGFWMDIFDHGLFFSSHVPTLAGLARVNGRKAVMGGQITAKRQSLTEKWPGPRMSAEAWRHLARQYYDLAVSLLRQALAGATRPSVPEGATPGTISDIQGHPLPSTDSDELVAATAVLCVYEFFDVSGAEWNRHLDGVQSLFDIANDRMMDLTRPPSPAAVTDSITQRLAATLGGPRPGLSKGRRGVFWCFVRQDMLSAFINNTHTRVDTSDLAAWRSAGLKIAPDGFVYPSNPSHADYIAENAMADDMICNAFIWLLAKLVNFLVTPHSVTNQPSLIGPQTKRQNLFTETWEELDAQLQTWYDSLPDSFVASAIRQPENENRIEEKWFPKSMCASTMQWWHFARIQMLHNKPYVAPAPISSSDKSHLLGAATPGMNLAQQHANYASITRQCHEHAKEIVAIGLGRSDEGARVHSVQPLWTAGLVLGMHDEKAEFGPQIDMWRRSIIEQLRGIETDTGWASEYRVHSLLELWGLPAYWQLEEAE
ncbi:hypothetical protein BDY17DRAFT_249552 [Neohortaea acidophila]|uniref:Zn(2)-C6 fungal-type domain-containing protein n=1 Tax=Neohortaea acidophila TaxID=245834 RepID=A0A6A6PV97_9PEZI|nr:uncharacterized protein BDY17DRAFT_249552 [Neohortaea acidophila]KAF2483912.1 hypothetical protein BDY17DRAFT_249552 [Neohortaea acidophila]